jgi:predicted RNA-binding Zn-ribbon protein involved in translation (DUF1610 family)
MSEDPRTAALEWITRALAAELELPPHQLNARAAELAAIAEQYSIRPEEAVKWIHYRVPEKEWSGEEFLRWCRKYRQTLELIASSDTERLCPQCHSAYAQQSGSHWLCPQCGEVLMSQ